MARYEHLPVYKAIYDMNLYFFKLSRNFPKDFKYGLDQEVRVLLSELLDLIIIANNSRDKLPALQKASLTIERMKFKVRLLHDMKVMKTTSYKHFFVQLVEISQQVKKWYDYCEGRNDPKKRKGNKKEKNLIDFII